MSKNTGKIVQVIGPVVDVAFENGELPQLLSAIEIPLKNQDSLIVEVAQHIGDERFYQGHHCPSFHDTCRYLHGFFPQHR